MLGTGDWGERRILPEAFSSSEKGGFLRMVVRKENQMYVRQVVEVNGRIGPPRSCHAGSEVDMISSV